MVRSAPWIVDGIRAPFLEQARRDIRIRSRRDADVGFLTVGGEIRLEIAARLEDSCRALMDAGVQHLLVDMRDVLFMDSASLAVLIQVDRTLRERLGRLVLYRLSTAVNRVLVLCGLGERFRLADNEVDALDHLQLH